MPRPKRRTRRRAPRRRVREPTLYKNLDAPFVLSFFFLLSPSPPPPSLSLSLSLFFPYARWRAFHPPSPRLNFVRRLAKRLAVILSEANDQVSRSRATQVDLVSADIPVDAPPRNRRSVHEARQVTREKRSGSEREQAARWVCARDK